MKKFDLFEKVEVVSGAWKGFVGTVAGYEDGQYRIRFGGRGRIVTHVSFRSRELKAAR